MSALYTILKVVLFLTLFSAFCAFFYYLRKSNVIGKKIKEVHGRLDETSIRRTKERRSNIGIQKSKSFIEKCLEKPEQRFIYSGIGKRFPGVTVEIWILMMILSAAGVYILSFVILQDFVRALIVMCAYVGIIELFESLLMLRNYRAVESDLLKFLNMLSNYTATNGEITGVFLQVSRFLKEPLKSELEECYYEAYVTGDNKDALEALANQIEHPMFKEIIDNINVCLNYSANYKEVVSSSRKIIRDEQRAREERKSVAKEAMINMMVLSIMFFIALQITDGLIEKSIWAVLFQTAFGNVCVGGIVVCYLIFAWKVWSVDR